MKTDLLREKFLDFFKSKKHKIIESDSLVPKDDPTVLFTPAGMNQFKKQFLGLITDFTRAASSQRCLRTDDLDKVGKTEYHHTFFEMLGNFSFGDYFKKEAISYAWEFLTEELKIKKEKLWVSVYQDDAEALDIWKDRIGIPVSRIVKLGDKENFWPSEAKQKGPNGPCGPCSEIFFDRGSNVGCKKTGCTPACSCGRFVEVWNLVFTQFNRKEGGLLEPLPKKNIDTGMGLERLAAVMQGVGSNFETDLFTLLTKEINSVCQVKNKELAYAVADHIRAIVFSIFDGVLPSNESRGYVVRKLIRKSVLHLNSLKAKQPFLYKLVPILAQTMNRPYPDLKNRQENIAEIILTEEKNFLATLDSSEDLLLEKFALISKNPDAQKAGVIAFELYDTFGIPLDLTKSWLDKKGIKISLEAFNLALSEQKARSKLQSQMRGDVFDVKEVDLGVKETKFLGYRTFELKTKVIKIFKEKKEVKKISKGEEARVILNKTVFYPESGGQVGDMGELIRGKNVFQVLDTQKSGDIILHIGKVKSGSFKKNDFALAKIDLKRRLCIARNHTATHLLQAALRKVLGSHVQQQGSFVGEDKLRFDFTHFKDIDRATLDRIEERVNGFILDGSSVSSRESSLTSAKKSGALAFFGEKYSQRVRVVSIPEVSRELCGGTHLDSTSQVGTFRIIHESSVASGVRRIEAVTGSSAYTMMKEEEAIVSQLALMLNVSRDKIAQQVQTRLERIKALEKEKTVSKIDEVKESLEKIIASAQGINGASVITHIMPEGDMDLLRSTVDMIKRQTKNSIIALGAAKAGKAILVMGVTEDLIARGFDASSLIREAALILEGSGGGRKDFAQAGGNRPENFTQAFSKLKDEIEKIK